LERLCLAGGVALNSVMNARLLAEAGFEELFVQPAASDAGNALGAAAWVWHQELGQPRSWTMEHPFWGPSWTEKQRAGALTARGLEFRQVGDAPAEAARRIADGKVVGGSATGPRSVPGRWAIARYWPIPGGPR
ncbi:MAG: carbamoyltransferase N-terminal domain-containing protein, partial [Acidimicrobiales bacterium]